MPCHAPGSTHQLFGLVQRALGSADGRFARLASRLLDLLNLLAQVRLYQLQLGLVPAEALRACVGIYEVGHASEASAAMYVCRC